METFISGLLLAIISGLAFLAVKHKEAFDKLYDWIIKIAFWIYFPIAIWQSAIHASFSILEKYIDKSKIEIAREALPLFPVRLRTMLICFMSMFIVLFVLTYISEQVNKPTKNQPEN